jgi:hypothetical protein
VITLLPETSKPPLTATQSLVLLIMGAPSLHVRRRSCDPELSLLFGAEVKNAWSYISTPPYALMLREAYWLIWGLMVLHLQSAGCRFGNFIF